MPDNMGAKALQGSVLGGVGQPVDAVDSAISGMTGAAEGASHVLPPDVKGLNKWLQHAVPQPPVRSPSVNRRVQLRARPVNSRVFAAEHSVPNAPLEGMPMGNSVTSPLAASAEGFMAAGDNSVGVPKARPNLQAYNSQVRGFNRATSGQRQRGGITRQPKMNTAVPATLQRMLKKVSVAGVSSAQSPTVVRAKRAGMRDTAKTAKVNVASSARGNVSSSARGNVSSSARGNVSSSAQSKALACSKRAGMRDNVPSLSTSRPFYPIPSNEKGASLPYQGMGSVSRPIFQSPIAAFTPPPVQTPMAQTTQVGMPQPSVASQVVGGRQTRGYGNTPVKQNTNVPGTPGRPTAGKTKAGCSGTCKKTKKRMKKLSSHTLSTMLGTLASKKYLDNN